MPRPLDRYTRAGAEEQRSGARRRSDAADDDGVTRSPASPGVASTRIKHVVFITKENLTHDLVLGDMLETRKGVMVNSDPAPGAGRRRQPQPPRAGPAVRLQRQLLPRADGLVRRPPLAGQQPHHRVRGDPLAGLVRRQAARLRRQRRDPRELARAPRLHRRQRLAPSPTTTRSTARCSPHLHRNGKSFINFGEGYEFAIVDEDAGTEPTGIRRARQHPDGEGAARQQRPPVPAVQHQDPRCAAAREPRSLQPLRPLPAGVQGGVRQGRRVQAARLHLHPLSRTTTAAAPTTSTARPVRAGTSSASCRTTTPPWG